jgi:tRNA G18 (ribose-2'-O)-methylase SpoU
MGAIVTGYTGAHSPRLKAARRLAKRAFRDRDRAFLAEGPQAVGEAFAHGAAITDLFVTAAARRKYAPLIDAIAAGNAPAGASAQGGPAPPEPTAPSGPAPPEPTAPSGPAASDPTPHSGPAASKASSAEPQAPDGPRWPRGERSELRGSSGREGPGGAFRPDDTADGSVAGGGSGGLVYTPQINIVNDATMSALAQTVTPQGLLAVCGFVDVTLREALAGTPRLVAVLANVRDPGNAGTVLRAADAAGADAVIFADASVDPYNAKCVRASAGSLFHLPVVTGVRLAEAAGELRDAGLRVVAADGRVGRSLDEPDVRKRLTAPTAWVFGNEAWGLPEELVALTDEAVAVPIYGHAESLNLATAAVVCLYATAQSQRVNENSV